MRPYLLLGGAQLAVGAAAIFARFALTGAQPLAVSAARLVIAALVLLGIAAARRDFASVRTTARERGILVVAGILLGVHFGAWIWSLEYTSVAISTLLVATTPLWTALYDAIVLKTPLSPLAWGAYGIGAIGLLLLVGFNTTPPPVAGHAFAGALLAIAGAIAIAAYFILIRAVRETLTTRIIVTRTYSWAAIALVAAALAARQPLPPLHAELAWGGVVAMALFSQLLGHTAMNSALQWFSPSTVAFTTLIEPVVAALLAFVVFSEALTPAVLAGGLLVLAAIAVVLREERQARLDLANESA